MIARTHRFHGRGSLRYVYSHGKTVRNKWCALKCAPNAKRRTYRAAVVVSKKIAKSAVVRNRIRRRIYEVIRLHTAETRELDMIFTVFSDHLADMAAEELQKIIRELLQMSGAEQGVVAPKPRHVQDKNSPK